MCQVRLTSGRFNSGSRQLNGGCSVARKRACFNFEGPMASRTCLATCHGTSPDAWKPACRRSPCATCCWPCNGHRSDRILAHEVRAVGPLDLYLYQALIVATRDALDDSRALGRASLLPFPSCAGVGVDLSYAAMRHDECVCLHLAGVSGAPGQRSHGDALGAFAPVRPRTDKSELASLLRRAHGKRDRRCFAAAFPSTRHPP
jgi:hypothetical protein